MTEGNSSNSHEKSWLHRIADAFSGEPHTREDLVQILRASHEKKLIDADALEIIEGALNVSDQQVREIMIPRSKMVLINEVSELQELLSVVIESGHSRFPVIGESTDDPKGILLAKDLLLLLREDQASEDFSVDRFTRPVAIIPESKRLNVLLREFREQRYHMAIVVDEYGSVSGLVTIEDILEEIVGEIEDETDEDEDQLIRPLQEGRFSVAALTPIEEFNEYFDTGLTDDEFDTIGGVIVHTFGRLPEVGESTELNNFCFTIIEGDNRQVKRLEARRLNQSSSSQSKHTE